MKTGEDADFNFRHLLRDVLLLQGAPLEIADLLDKSQDGITEADVEVLRGYAISLFGRNKSALRNLHKIKLTNEN